MAVLQKGYRGLSLLVLLNADRLFIAAVLCSALFLGAYIGTL